jgi:hypothetical protein
MGYEPNGPGPLLALPTAVQARADAHDTPFRLVEVAPAGSGVAWTVHRRPSHRNANALPLSLPTAVQAFAELHDTPLRLAPSWGAA